MLTPSADNHLAGLSYRVRRGPAFGPLVIMLHGLGGDEHVMGIFERAVPEPFTVISPRAPIAIEPGMFPGYTDRGYSWLRSAFPADRSSLDTALDQMRRFVLAALDKYKLDRDRVFLMGFSQGAAISYALSLAEPHLIASVIALAGFLPEVVPPSAVSLRRPVQDVAPRHGYLIIHGTDDQTVPLLRAHQARDFLRALGAPVEYHAYPIGHKVAPPGLKDITRWLTSSLDH